MSSDFKFLPEAGGGDGDVVGPASSTDNAVARFDGATGKLLQNSPVTISDAGTIETTLIGSGEVDAFNVENESDVRPVIRWNPAAGDLGMTLMSGNNVILRLQDNGAVVCQAGLALTAQNSISAGAPTIDFFGEGAFAIQFESNGVQGYTGGMFRYISNLATNVVQVIQGIVSQSADLLQFRDSAGTVLSSFDSAGQLSFETAETTFWATSVPATQKEAIERLAKAVSNDGASPIPEL